ncbi:MAG: M28 family peptidase [Hydrogeniiclostridium mannosilyticum]
MDAEQRPCCRNLLKQAGAMAGLTLNEAKIYPGATDAEAFSRYGMRACGLCGVDHDLKTYYHTREDNADNINPACLEKSLEICRYAMQLYDKSSGIDDYNAR